MPEKLILVRVASHELDSGNLARYASDTEAVLRDLPGYLGSTHYTEVDRNDHGVLIHRYESAHAAADGLRAISGRRLYMPATQVVGRQPADVLSIDVDSWFGSDPDALSSAPLMSMSVRVADPGYGRELLDDVGIVFGELAALPGYLGAVAGTSDSLAEEVVGLAFWESRVAFASSLPHRMPYTLTLYARSA